MPPTASPLTTGIGGGQAGGQTVLQKQKKGCGCGGEEEEKEERG